MPSLNLREGLYDSLLTAQAQAPALLDGTTAQTHTLDETNAPARLAQFLADEVRRLLGDLHGEERVARQAAIVNDRVCPPISTTSADPPAPAPATPESLPEAATSL